MACKLAAKKALIKTIKSKHLDKVGNWKQLSNDTFELIQPKSNLNSSQAIKNAIRGIESIDSRIIAENKNIDGVNTLSIFAQDSLLEDVLNYKEEQILKEFQEPRQSIKPGVSELFESNPELANAVYEAAGFYNKSYSKSGLIEVNGQKYRLSVNINEGNLKLDFSLPNDYGAGAVTPVLNLGLKQINNLFKTIYEKVNPLLTEYPIKNIIIGQSNIQGDIKAEQRKNLYLRELRKYFPNITLFKSVKEQEQYLGGDLYSIGESIITPQQKATAQQLYSSYLDTIFPDSKVKDIVYRGDNTTNYNKNKTGVFGKGIYFSQSKVLAKFHADKVKGQVNSAILNTINPNTEYYFHPDFKQKTGYKSVYKEIQLNKNEDAIVGLRADSLGEIKEYVVFEPEQIHILGSKQDIEGFKKFTNNQSSVLLQTNRNNILAFENLNDENKLSLLETYSLFNANSDGIFPFTATVSEINNHLKANELPPSIKAQKNSFNEVYLTSNGVRLSPEKSFSKQSENNLNKQVYQKLKTVLDFLQNKYGIRYEFNSNLEALGQFDPVNNIVSINPSRAKLDTPFHEFAHPLILLIKKEHKSLYNALINEAKKDKELLFQKSKTYQGLSEEQLFEEVLAEKIGKEAANNYANKKMSSLIDKMLKFISNLLSNIFGISANLSKQSTISDIAYLLGESNKSLDLSNVAENLSDDYNFNMQQVSEEELDAFEKTIEESGIQDFPVDQFFKNLELDLKAKFKTVQSKITAAERGKAKLSGTSIAKIRQRYSDLIDLLDVNRKMASIVEVIKDSHSDAKNRYHYFIDNILPKLQTLDQITDKEELESLIEKVDFYNSYANNFGALRELLSDPTLKMMSDVLLERGANENPFAKLSDTLRILDKIRDNVNGVGKKLIAKTVYKEVIEDSVSDSTVVMDNIQPRIERIQNNIDTLKRQLANAENEKAKSKLESRISKFERDKKQLEQIGLMQKFDEGSVIEMLSVGQKDIGSMDMWTLPAISSPDLAVSFFARWLKNKYSDLRIQAIEFEREVSRKYDELKKVQGGKLNSEVEFNDFIEIVTENIYDSNGEIQGTRQVKKLIEPIDRNKYRQAWTKMKAESRSIKAKKGVTEARDFERRWYAENTEKKSQDEINQIIKDKKNFVNQEIWTEEDYNEWIDSPQYYKEISQPAYSKYKNTKYEALNLPQNRAKKEFFDWYLQKYLEFQEKLPVSHRKGLKLPSIDKGFRARARENGLLNALAFGSSDFISYKSKDQHYGITNFSGDAKANLPIYFTQNMTADETSSDLVSSIMMFGKMAMEYELKESVLPKINIITNVMNERKYIKTDSRGLRIKDHFANREGVDRDVKDSEKEGAKANSTKMFLDFLDNVIYGKNSTKMEYKGIAIDKLIDKMMGWQAVSTLGGLRPLKEVANNLQANVMVALEAAGSEFYNPKNLANAHKFLYKWGNMTGVVNDMINNKGHDENLITQLVKRFDVIQGETMNNIGRNISGNISKKIFSRDKTFFFQNLSEFEPQIKAFLAMMDSIQVKQGDKTISLLNAWEKDSNGDLKLKDGVEFSRQDERNFEARLHAMGKRIYGVYNSFDRPSIQKDAIGRSVMMFRKFMPPSFKKRFKSLGYDAELDAMTEGMYSTFGNFIVDAFRTQSFNLFKNYKTLTPLEQANMRRFTFEMVAITLVGLIAMGLNNAFDDDDEPENIVAEKALNASRYWSIRLLSELKQYLPLLGYKDLARVAMTPSITASYLEKVIKAVHQTFGFDFGKDGGFKINDRYERDSGMWQKGEYKALARWFALFGITGNELNPEYATKNLKRFL